MRELLYVAPARAGSGGAIGLLVPELANPVFPALAEAMEQAAAEQGLASILCNTGGAAEREAVYVRMLLAREVGGMIFISGEATDLRGSHGHYKRLLDQGARLVFVNGALSSLDVASVAVDERAAGEIATQHLLDLGHRRIGFVAGPPHSRPTLDKAQGRRMALAAAHVPDGDLIAHAPWGAAGGADAMRQLLRLPKRKRPTGVICSSDVMAIGALREARRSGFRVPGDISIVGFDGVEAGEWTDPPLTTLAQPIDDIAVSAVKMLVSLITRPAEPARHATFRPKLVVRESTAPAS